MVASGQWANEEKMEAKHGMVGAMPVGQTLRAFSGNWVVFLEGTLGTSFLKGFSGNSREWSQMGKIAAQISFRFQHSAVTSILWKGVQLFLIFKGENGF